MAIPKEIIEQYNKTRISANKQILCHAPFQSMNFTQNGSATVCCYNKKYVLGTFPTHTIAEMWFGEIANKLRKEIRENPLPEGCENCALQLNSGNFAAVHARHYDFNSDHPVKHFLKKGVNWLKNKEFTAYPRVIEFELSNTCNLECVMCNGYFSSSIRKNIEKQPPMKMVFNDAFLEQLAEFIPHLTDAKFLGGEPFLIPIYSKIWEMILELNPTCKVHITTNATMISEKIWDLLDRLNAVIIVSTDSLSESNYNKIRRGASWKEVEKNIARLEEYAKTKKTDLNFSVCPMTLNWEEMPSIIQYGIDKRIYIYFNTVIYPEELSLKNIDIEYAKEIISVYEAVKYNGNGFYYSYNLKQISGLINMIKYWHNLP